MKRETEKRVREYSKRWKAKRECGDDCLVFSVREGRPRSMLKGRKSINWAYTIARCYLNTSEG